MDYSSQTLLQVGAWGELAVTWKLYQTGSSPPLELCTAVMCVAIAKNKVVLARSKRGWGMLGGHIEDGEDQLATLRREAKEEGGFMIDNYQLFAVREITSTKPLAHQQPGKTYPFPTSYMTYYLATTDQVLEVPNGLEILESRSFTINEVTKLNTPDQFVIEEGWRLYIQLKSKLFT